MLSESKRIILLSTSYRPLIGGAEIALEKVSELLSDFKFDLITQRYKKDLPSIEERGNITIHRVGVGMKGDKFFLPILGALKALNLMKKNNYRCFHAYQASYAGGAGWVLSFLKPKIPFVLTLQEGKELSAQHWLIKTLRKMVMKRADVITVISKYLKNYATELGLSSKVVLIPNGVDEKLFSSSSAYPDFSGNKKVVISISRLVKKNGVDNLIRGFSLLGEDYKLAIIGSGPLREDLEDLAKSLGVAERVEFLGDIEYNRLPGYLKASVVFVRPSLSEGLGNAFLDAMAAGVPIIGTPVGGIPDFLEDKKTGLFCRVNDPEDIAECIRQISQDDALRSSLVVNATELVRSKFTWEIVSNQFRSVYESL